MICMSLYMSCISEREINFHPTVSIKAMKSLITIADNLEPWLRRINMRHQREVKKLKKLTPLDQIIYGLLKPEAV